VMMCTCMSYGPVVNVEGVGCLCTQLCSLQVTQIFAIYFFHHSLQCRDTFYIESFHVVVLTDAPKRIHFGDGTYEMRVLLAVLDWVSWLET